LTTVIDSHVILTAAGTLALPRLIRTALLPRVLGLYLATCAGAIQLLDITVDRFALDDRFFTFAIILALLGIPCAGAGAILAEAARTERRP
jgi:Na+-transporting NADH:ubiquinone oxidoreductase subunit NqrE